MTRFCWTFLAGATVALAAHQVLAESLNFQDAKTGALPQGWTSAKTGKGEGSVWKIAEDKTSADGGKALAQISAEGPGPLFNLCIANDTKLQDGELTVQVKAVSGKIDQGGGPVWRLRDADNYYIARINPLESNFRVYKVIDGKRTQLATAPVETKAGQWHTIRIVQRGQQIQCYLDGKLHLDVKDDALTEAGKIGLWTKADAQTRFAGIQVK
jgi:hypothetical protein